METNLDVIRERLDNLITDNEEEHARILEQTTKTNGEVADLKKWRFFISGAVAVLSTLVVPIIVAIAIKYIMKVI